MRIHLKSGIAAAVLCAALSVPTPSVEAGGVFGMHIGTSGFGVSVGIGDWSTYTARWTNPQFSLDYNATLSGYGEWVSVANLGRVWRPWVSVGWKPYTYGRWVLTTLGWTWVAYEPWGYVPHHFGSWAMCDFGWVWVPGYTYVSANVVWVRSGGYVGWYARPPRGWSHTARSYSLGYRDGYHDGWRDARYATYVDWHHMGSENVSHYAVRHTVAAHGRVQDHAAPPTAEEVRRRGGISVTETRLSQRTVTMNGRRVSVARPEGVARSIELHASETAAAALSPRALERRQPSVRPVPSSQRAASDARGGAIETSSTRPLLTGGRSRSPEQSERRRSAAMADPRADLRTGSNAAAPTVRPPRSSRTSDSVGTTPGGFARHSSNSSASRDSSGPATLDREQISRSTARPGGSGASLRTSGRLPALRGSATNRSVAPSVSAPRSSVPRGSSARAPIRSPAARTQTAGAAPSGTAPSSRRPGVRRLQANTPAGADVEPESKSSRSRPVRKK